ncbi:dhhc zinc finger domain containing protein [Stylonychia lemnae]|uniref:Palmitoyltransferase n=1 Tax=Stylonychia lemnae TaxID=5949 RepID=A0A078B618_STYLE|nr:dhhc zinc finger domain containing protein [Stylonychia lemnae]|eukprot:CDW89859.1 dhhc zinc finger domain containing protein [Stylonychia lemnae]
MGWQMTWHARSRSICRGKFFVGPRHHRPLTICIATIILAGLIGWIQMSTLLSKDFDSLFLFGVYLLTTSLTLFFFLSTTYSDPGVLFRHKDYEYFKQQYDERKAQQRQLRQELNLDSSSSESSDSDLSLYDDKSSMNKSNASAKQLFMEKTREFTQGNDSDEDNSPLDFYPSSGNNVDMAVDGTGGSQYNFEDENEKRAQIPRIYRSRFCNTCYIFRPPLSSHCRYCDQCVLHFDHHCYLVNNCIGRRNFKHFVLFVNNSLISSIIFIYCYNTRFIPQWCFENENFRSSPDKFDAILLYSHLILIVVAMIEIVVSKLRMISFCMALLYVILLNNTLFDKVFNQNLGIIILYAIQCYAFGSSLGYSMQYLYLNYLGQTMKEFQALKDSSTKRRLCINPITGFKNLLSFYFDCDSPESEFQKEFARPVTILSKKQLNQDSTLFFAKEVDESQ